MPLHHWFNHPSQFIRIFVIVNITTYISTKAYLDSRNTPPQSLPPSQPPFVDTMAPRAKGENTKKAAGNLKKAEAAAAKQSVANARAEEAEANKWEQGSKDTSKKAAAAEKAAATAAKKAEREALLAAEEKDQPSKPKGAGKKVAEKKNVGRPLDLGQLDDDTSSRPELGSKKQSTLNASGIDNALDALSLTTSSTDMKLDRHPERRFAAAYKSYEERRLPEIKTEHPGLRRNQQIELIRKEFEKSEENPFNQVGNVRYDAGKEELMEAKKSIRDGVEKRLGEK
jgi:hypothetical protein